LWLEFGKFPLKRQIFQFLTLQVKKISSGRPLIYCGSKESSGQVGSGPISSLQLIGIGWQNSWRYNSGPSPSFLLDFLPNQSFTQTILMFEEWIIKSKENFAKMTRQLVLSRDEP